MLGKIAAVALGFVAATPLLAQDTQELTANVTRLRKDLEGAKTSDPNVERMMPRLREALGQLENPEFREQASMQAEMLLVQMGPRFPSETLQQECAGLAKLLRARREATQKEKDEKIQAALDAAAQVVRAAKKAEDLDKTLAALSALQAKEEQGDYGLAQSGLRNQLQAAVRFTTSWQDYLAARSAGNLDSARSALQNLSQSGSGSAIDWIPRSQILKLLNKGPRESDSESEENPRDYMIATVTRQVDQSAEILAKVQTPEDLPAALEKLRAIVNEPRGFVSGYAIDTFKALNSLNESYQDFRAGLPVEVELSLQGDRSGSVPNPVPRIRSQILLMVLPRALGLPPEVKPREGEGVADFLARVEADAGAKGDYSLAARTQRVSELIRYGGRDSGRDSQAEQFIRAENQDQAGQFDLAVASYLRALAVPERVVPAKVVGDRLKALKSAHPAEFANGMELYLYPQGKGNPRPAPSMMMSPQQRPTPPPLEKLSVPAAPVSSKPSTQTP